jgi:phage terminase large subunit
MVIKFPKFNGSEIIFSGIDESEKIKSISRITNVFVEESTELDESDLDDIVDRLRGNTDYYKQVIIAFNPINASHWLKKKFFDSEDLKGDTTIHHSTYINNDFIDPEYGEGLKKDTAITQTTTM